MLADERRMQKTALTWLAARQHAKGHWPAVPNGAADEWDAGLTALCVLAWTGTGRVPQQAVRGLAYLVSVQSASGEIRGPRTLRRGTVEHVWATLALCEAYALTHDVRWKRAAQRGVAYLLAARFPYMGWTYGHRKNIGTTHLTTLAVLALRVAQDVGLVVDDPDAWEGAGVLIDKLTDQRNGAVAYDPKGAPSLRLPRQTRDFPADRTHGMTAAGILTRILLGQKPTSRTVMRSVDHCLAAFPRWTPDDGTLDLYSWHLGTLAMAQVGGAARARWFPELRGALLDGHAKDGSWPPVGAWGVLGGGVYSTAMGVLCLQARFRYKPWRVRPLRPGQAALLAALREAARTDRDPAVKAAAAAAVREIKKTLRR